MKSRDLAQQIYDLDPIIKQTETSFVFDSGKRIIKRKFIDEFFDLNNFMPFNSKIAARYALKNEDARRKTRHRVKNHLCDIVDENVHNLRSRITYSDEAVEGLNEIVTDRFSFKDMALFRSVDRKSNGKMFVYDLITKELTDIDPQYYIQCLPKDIRGGFVPTACTIKYDPYSLSPTKVIEKYRQQVTEINLYKPPQWRLDEFEGPVECPSLAADLMYHLFDGNHEAISFIVAWLKKMILRRNETALVLNGAKGTGKNIFISMSIKLVGEENSGKAPVELLDSKFNGVLENKRLIYHDECKIDKKKHTRLKDILNSNQNIERKGIEADNMTETYNSHIIANNDSHDFYTEYDDRRFSAPPLTEETLLKAFGQKKIDRLLEALEDPKFIQQLGNWILEQEHPVYDAPNYMWKCEKFHSLVFTSLHGWQQYMVEYLLNDPVMDGVSLMYFREDAEDAGIRFPTNKAKVENFLMNYLHRGEIKLGYLKKIDKKWMLFPEEFVNIEDDL